jgi:hypothetical protein
LNLAEKVYPSHINRGIKRGDLRLCPFNRIFWNSSKDPEKWWTIPSKIRVIVLVGAPF